MKARRIRRIRVMSSRIRTHKDEYGPIKNPKTKETNTREWSRIKMRIR